MRVSAATPPAKAERAEDAVFLDHQEDPELQENPVVQESQVLLVCLETLVALHSHLANQ